MNLGRVSSAALMLSGAAGVVMPGRVASALQLTPTSSRGMGGLPVVNSAPATDRRVRTGRRPGRGGGLQVGHEAVDLPAGKVAVESGASVDTLKAAIDEAGYTVVGVDGN